jgi:hypothetical protein
MNYGLGINGVKFVPMQSKGSEWGIYTEVHGIVQTLLPSIFPPPIFLPKLANFEPYSVNDFIL